MGSVNVMNLTGKLGTDPEYSISKSGAHYCVLDLITSEYRPNGKSEIERHRVVVEGPKAKACERLLKKDSLVAVTGRLKYRSWESGGQVHTRAEVRAIDTQFLASLKDRIPYSSTGEILSN